MTEQHQTPDIAENEDVEGHEHHWARNKDNHSFKDDDTEGHNHAWNKDSHSIKDDDTEGHQHGSV